MTYGEDRIYKKVEVIGISKSGIEDAIQSAVRKASQSIEQMSWFEVSDIRGHIDEQGNVSEYQVVIKISFMVK